ncbi:MAG: hypothetical protein J5636_06015 [Clostridiales bacterium]|nr:hypothetical protein [Clostridiales bacterium]
MRSFVIFLLYALIGTIAGSSLVFMIVSIRLSRCNRLGEKKKKTLPDKFQCHIDVSQDNMKGSEYINRGFIRENMEYLVNRPEYLKAADHALYMKDSDKVRHDRGASGQGKK